MKCGGLCARLKHFNCTYRLKKHSSYIMVYALKCVIMCESGKGASWGLRLWHRFGFVVTIIVVVSGLFLAASLAQCQRACWASLSVCGWAYPFHVHLCWTVVPIDPNTLSRENGDKNCQSV